jgi:CRP-like cAMP-binding protein
VIPNFEQLHVSSGEIVLKHGDPGDALYIIIDGIVRVFLPPGGKTREIGCFGPGDCFGEMALLTGETSSANIEAMTNLNLLRLSKESFDQLIRMHHSLGQSPLGLLLSFAIAATVLKIASVISVKNTFFIPHLLV